MKKHKLLKVFLLIIIFCLVTFLVLLYGPYPNFREFLITSSMTTKRHQFIAKFFYSDKVINEVMNKNKTIEPKESTNKKLIEVDQNVKFTDEYDEQILIKDLNHELYKVIEISGKNYQGFLIAIYDPSRVKIATTRYLGQRGESITTVSKNNNAIIAMNAGGFYDPDWNSNGAIPHGIVIKDGKVVSRYNKANVGGGLVGFDNNNILILGKYSEQQALDMGIRDAVEFGPFLIVNGESAIVKGNGGWGIAPRTAIGQRKDGIVLFLVINGRIPSSIGADMKDLVEIMQRYKAINAANMDGGSSTELVINNEIINKPVAGGEYGLRDMPTFWIVQ